MSSKKKLQPKNQRVKRALAAKAPKLVENVKKSLILKGSKASDVVQKVLKDVYAMKKPDAKMFQRRNLTRPMEDPASVEFFGKSNDCSLFLYGSHSKKRPHNLVFGRLFDSQMLDMVEVGVEQRTFKSMADFEGTRKAVVRAGSKPMFIFQGEEFDSNTEFATLKSVLLDFFRGEQIEKLNLAGLDRVIVCTARGDMVHFRHYGVTMKASGTRYPKAQLDLAGPSIDFKIRRVQSASEELQRLSMQKPKKGSAKKRKNKETGLFGDKMGRLHMERQSIGEIQLKKMKGLKRRKLDPEQKEQVAALKAEAKAAAEAS